MATTKFDFAVIGAGVLGASTASHLASGGAKSVALIDAGVPASGTSDAGAGFVGTWAAGYMPAIGENEVRLEQYGLEFYRSLHERSDIHFRNHGSLFTAVSEDGLESLDTIAEHPLAPAGTRRLSAAQTAEITKGLLDPAMVVESVIHPTGIQISAGEATRVLASQTVEAGVTLIQQTRIEAIEELAEGYLLRAGDAQISARRVVVAAGAWSNELLSSLGTQLPLHREIASRVISPPSRVSKEIPTLMVREWGLWLREEQGGLTWASGEYSYAPLREFAQEVPLGSRPTFGRLIERMEEQFLPKLKTLIPNHDLSTQQWVQGLPCYTPDGFFIAGELSNFKGLYVIGGDNEAGVTHGPGLGRALAEQMLGQSAFGFDLAPYSPSRFDDRVWTEEDVQRALPRYN